MTFNRTIQKAAKMLKLRYFGIVVISLIASSVLILGLTNYSSTQAASYDNINFQGKLTDANGFGVVSSTKSVTFCIFSASSGGSCSSTPSGQLWYETKNVTTDARGIFNTALGDTTSFGTLFTAYANTTLYLAVNVAGDGEMVPRHPIGSVPNAYSSQTLLGKTWSAPGAIGATTASSGAFTTISATGALTSTIATGNAPFVITSNTMVGNLNADLLDGSHASAFAPSSGSGNYVQLQATTPGAQQSGNVNISGIGIFGTGVTASNVTLSNPGVGGDSTIAFLKTNDQAWVSVKEVSPDSTDYGFYMADNPDGGDRFFWRMNDWQGKGGDWMPLLFEGMNAKLTATNVDIFSNLNIYGPSFTANGVANTSSQSDLAITRTGTASLTPGVSGYTGTSATIYWVTIDGNGSPDTFKWGTGYVGNVPTATGVAITGSAQTLSNGVTVNFDSTTNAALNDTWQFRVIPGGHVLVGTGAVGSPSLSFTGDTNTGIYSSGADSLELVTAGVDRITIDSTGNVGIGTNSTTSKLEVAGEIKISGQSPGLTLDAGSGDSGAYLNLHGRYLGVDYPAQIFANYLGGLVMMPNSSLDPTVTIGHASGAVGNTLGVYGKTAIGATYYGVAAPVNGLIVEGNVGIGLTNPTGKLHLAAGAATAGTAPLKFTAGTNLSVAEAGAVEWDGSRLYITQTSGPTRKTVAYTDEITSGMANPMTTTGDIIYANNTASPATPARLAGSSGFLKSTGAAAPSWSSVTKTDVGLGNVPNLTFSGSNTGDQTITLTGDVTGSGTGSFTTTIANNSVDGTDIALGSDTTGDIMYYNGTDYVRLAGSSGFLKSTGAAAPSWSTIADADVPDTITLTNITQITNRDHGSLTGLTDDDHSIYALLAGRATGQILTGGTGSTDDLVLKTTSGAGTSGADMIFQTGTNGGTEAMRILYNGDVGIGTPSPNSRLEVYRGGAVAGSNYGIGTTNATTSSTAGISKFGIASTVTGSWNNSNASSQTYGAQFSNSTTGGYGTYGVVAMNTSSGVYNYGGYFAAIGGGTNNYAVYASGSGGGSYNYGIYSASGNNYMGDQLALGRANTSVGNNYYLVIGNGSSGSLYAGGVIKGAGGFNGQCLIDAANQFKDAATRSCNMDIAEIYESTEDIVSGDVVMIDPDVDGKVKKSIGSYNSALIGIATSTPGVILGYNGGDVMMAGQANTYMETADPRKPAIALIGKAPIKISLENGPIHKGDILTSSSTPGVAMKATKPGMAIGKALMDSSDQEDGKIMAYIHSEFVDVGGQVNSALSSINSLYDQYAQIQNEISGIRNDLLIQDVSGATGLLSPKQESILESFDINVEGHLVVKGDLEIKGKLELSNSNSRGANVVVVEGSNGIEVVFDKPRESKNYTVLVTPSWMTNFAVKEKSEKGFKVEFSVEAPKNSTADWLIID